MQKRSAKFVVPLAIASAAVLAVSTGLASASGTSRGGTVRIYEADTNLAGNQGTVVLTGAITDHGTDCQGCDPINAGYNVLQLSPGNSFEIDVSKVGNKLGNLPVVPVDQTTCSSDGTVAGPVPIVPGSGTGVYQGITGTFDVQVSAAYVVPRASDGTCETNATQYPGIMIVKGSGTVSYTGNN
jgi:hypothetical protein